MKICIRLNPLYISESKHCKAWMLEAKLSFWILINYLSSLICTPLMLVYQRFVAFQFSLGKV